MSRQNQYLKKKNLCFRAFDLTVLLCETVNDFCSQIFCLCPITTCNCSTFMWSIAANSGDVMALRVTCQDCHLMQHHVIVCMNVVLIGWMATRPPTNNTSQFDPEERFLVAARLWVHFIIFQWTQDCLRSSFLFFPCQEPSCYTHLNLMPSGKLQIPGVTAFISETRTVGRRFYSGPIFPHLKSVSKAV